MTAIAAPAVMAERSAPRPFVLGGVLAAGGLAAAATVAGVGSDPLPGPDASSVLRAAVVASYVVAGVYTWWRRPSSRFGLYLAAVGLIYSVGALTASDEPVPHSVGRVTHAAFVVALVYVLLCYPRDRLGSEPERRLVGVLAVSTVAVWAVAVPLVEMLPAGGPLVSCGDECPENVFRVAAAPEVFSDAINLAVNAVTGACLVALAAVLFGKARSPGRLRRRLIVPLLACAAVMSVSYAAFTLLDEVGVGHLGALRGAVAVSGLAIPAAIIVGQMRGRVFAAAGLSNLVSGASTEAVTPERVQEVLRYALGDPLLTLALRRDGGWVDVRGRRLELPTGRRDVSVTPISRGGRQVAAVVHDPALDEASGVTEGLAATALVLLENARLVDELTESRTRIVTSAQQERLRLERNLHDGAQQRLFAIQLKLRAASARVADPALADELAELADDADAAVDELRAVARGLYPPVLRERGLADALRAFAQTAAVPVTIADRDVPRCSAVVEEAVYYCVLEAIQNVAKHAGSGARTTVTVARAGSDLEFVVADDGAGFDIESALGGMGLVSMRDRMGAVGGDVELTSRPGAGTTLVGVARGCYPPER